MELKSLISSIISENPSPGSINEFIFLCRKIALVHLRRKIGNGHLSLDFFHTTLGDLALDTIADLFNRGEQGEFIQLQAYFEGFSIDESSEENLLTDTRRLVCSRVNQNLFRFYQEIDPLLGKILRNVKLAVDGLQNFVVVERFNEQCIVPSMCETLEHLPAIERTDLDQEMQLRASGTESIPSLLAKLSQYLREQTARSRIVSLMEVAITFRSVYSSKHEGAVEKSHQDDHIVENEAQKIIECVCRKAKDELQERYVGKQKVGTAMYENYFKVIEQTMVSQIVGRDAEGNSLFESLRAFVPDLARDEYNKQHKSKLEYLARLTRRRVTEQLKKDF
ncbi:MAG: hypothetical protein ABSF91_04870 [Bacteroidota bacterium]|jgi:hypothetical protein